MAAFATPDELATYLRTATQAEADAGSPDILDTVVASQVLDTATGYIRGECHWNITSETVTENYRLRGNVLHLPTLRLTSVLSLTVEGVALADGRDYFWEQSGRVELWAYAFPGRRASVQISYTHGWPEPPDAIRGVCLEIAAQLYPNPSRHLSETSDGVSTVYARAGGGPDPRLAPYVVLAVA